MVNDNIEQTELPGQGRRSSRPWSHTNTMPNSSNRHHTAGAEGTAPTAGPDVDMALLPQTLSALMDGELAPGELAGVCAAWQQDSGARACWHAYHLIGDVLRSDDLAAPAPRDEHFLQLLRSRLVLEPVPEAPAPWVAAVLPAEPGAASLPSRRRAAGWWSGGGRLLAPTAVAAGFMLVAGGLVVNKLMQPAPAVAPQLAQSAPAGDALVRDARLDRYLAAHRSLGSSLAPAGGAERTVQIVYEQK